MNFKKILDTQDIDKLRNWVNWSRWKTPLFKETMDSLQLCENFKLGEIFCEVPSSRNCLQECLCKAPHTNILRKRFNCTPTRLVYSVFGKLNYIPISLLLLIWSNLNFDTRWHLHLPIPWPYKFKPYLRTSSLNEFCCRFQISRWL